MANDDRDEGTFRSPRRLGVDQPAVVPCVRAFGSGDISHP